VTLLDVARFLRHAGWVSEPPLRRAVAFQDCRHLPAGAFRRVVVTIAPDGGFLYLAEHRGPDYVRDISGVRRFATLDDLDCLLATSGLKSIPWQGAGR
jgi:hypothetical protein